MSKVLTREEAWELLNEYNKEPFHLRHGETVEGVMRYLAQELGYGDEVDFWGNVGLLHDLDFEQWPEEHCAKVQELMRERDIDERMIHAVASHGYGICCDIAPEHEMDKHFAAGCDREIIKTGAERLGWELDELIQKTLDGMKADERNA